ncbi:EAL domain-containing protein [Pseudomonas trivialis]|uniref:Histidine kinase n=1 Tax=Pseudomonas trivialis TaxID=200450 RepID=A0A0H5AIE2_9PSED|nr:EAL domain-containing protein [Pseudomonas trivialis]AKS09435.1 histidine kinase [Pseudomonas trivialis]
MDEATPTSDYEAQRLQRVAALCARDAEPDVVFEKLVAMTSNYFGAPIALISIIDEHQQWFKARIGIEEEQTAREISFCAYSLFDRVPLEILDSHNDERFINNPMVTGTPYIRYYASAPLMTTDGFSLGSLCIIDTVPRAPMSERDFSMLVYFADLVMMHITGARSRIYIDQPTGLFNRLRFEEDIRQAAATSEHFHVFAVDIVSPAFLNNVVKALGYNFVQDLILAIKARLHALLPSQCLLYKISPTRFGFLSKGSAPLEQVCTRILEDFHTPVECHGIPILMHAGIGVLAVTSGEPQDWIRLVVAAADDARDRNLGWSLYQPHIDAAQQRAFMLLSSLPDAMRARHQLSLVFQPKIQLPQGECSSVEALLRWEHPEFGAIPPSEFIPLAETTALMHSISFWVLDAVLHQALSWKQQGLVIRIAMNVTAGDLETPRFIDKMINDIHRLQLDPATFELEFTESALMTDADTVSRQLERARGYGIGVAIDDFGTGYSNWTYLRQLPIDSIKLDQSLISNIKTQEKDARLVKTLIELARGLSYKVVAEGVETADILELITQWGCSEAQGFLISKPMGADALAQWFQAGGYRTITAPAGNSSATSSARS